MAVVRRVSDQRQLVVLLARRENRTGGRTGGARLRAPGARAERARLRRDPGRGRIQRQRLRRGVAVVELAGVARIRPADVAPDVPLRVDLDRADDPREVVVVDEDRELRLT